MAKRNSGTSIPGTKKERDHRREARRHAAKRQLLLESLESRQLMAVVGPKLAGIQPTDGALLALENVGVDGRIGTPDDSGAVSVRNQSPRDLTIRFDENQVINRNTLAAGVRIRRAGPDGKFSAPGAAANDDVLVQPGYLGVGDAPSQNEIIVRFAETLPDDLYRVELFGLDDALLGVTAIRNSRGEAFGDTTADGIDNGANATIDFSLELGPQVIAVVPQPISRVPVAGLPNAKELQQSRNTIVVYFNDDDLFVEDKADGTPTQRSAENPDFYRLIFTKDSVTNTDDVFVHPRLVNYDPVTDSATLTFDRDISGNPIDDLMNITDPGEPKTFRLRIGTDEQTPAPPVNLQPKATVSSSFGNPPATVNVVFTANQDFGKSVNLRFSEQPLGLGNPPLVNASSDEAIEVVLNSDGTTADQLRIAINGNAAAAAQVSVSVTGTPATQIIGSGVSLLRVVGLGSSFDTASSLGALTAQSLLLSSAIDPQEFALDFSGSKDEPGHRDIPNEAGSGFEQHVNPAFGPDATSGVTTILYNFRSDYGINAQGLTVTNVITPAQQQRAREAVEMWGNYLGVQFLETANQGVTIVTGDLDVIDPNAPNVLAEAALSLRTRIDPTFSTSMIILDERTQWIDDFGQSWFESLMVGMGAVLGLERANDLPPSNLMAYDAPSPFLGGNNVEPVYPGNADIIHGQFVHRPDSNDIDLYKFTIDLDDADLDEGRTGLFTAESFAERLPNSSLLDTVLSLYREVAVRNEDGDVIGFERELVARNDDYFSSDSFISMELASGTYYIGISSRGNTDFDPVIEDTGFGGTSQGKYDLRLTLRPQVDDDNIISDLDRLDEARPGTRLDGDGDGDPGGVYNFWFQARPEKRVIEVTGDGNTYVDGQTLTVEDAFGLVRRFEFDNNGARVNPTAIPINFADLPSAATTAQRLAAAIGSAGFNSLTTSPSGNIVTLTGERVAMLSADAQGVSLQGKTIFVDKTSGANLRGTLKKPFDSVATAFAAAVPGDIVRFVGNGGVDGNQATIRDNFAYEVGFGSSGGPAVLADGSSMNVPQGVTTMIDAGAIFKLRRARIGVGSTSLSVDRSGGSLQVLGTPGEPVYFTSWLDETIGRDTHPPTTTGAARDWGGIAFRADLDNAEAKPNLEDQGIFLNYVNHALVRYGGGTVVIDSNPESVTPIQMLELRPTISFNTITDSAEAAMSADPDSFEETNFHSPRYQLVSPFTSDYERIGPEIHHNYLLRNSINGLFVRIETPAGTELKPLTVPGRFDDIDIVHVIAEELKIQGLPGQALLEESRPDVDLVTLATTPGGALPVGAYTYKLVFVDENGFEGRPSEVTASIVVVGGASQNSVRLDNLPPVSGNFETRRLYRSQTGGAGPFNLVAELGATDNNYTDRGTVPPSPTGDLLERDPPSILGVTLESSATNPGLPAGTLSGGLYNYRIVFTDATGASSPASDASPGLVINGGPLEGTIRLLGLPTAHESFTTRQIFRSSVGGGGKYTLVEQVAVAAAAATFDDTGAVPTAGTLVMDPTLTGVVRARPDARLKIDPGTIVKMEGSRFEIAFGAQLIAEGLDGEEVILTSKADDRFGAGGTFDTNDDGSWNGVLNPLITPPFAPRAGDWGGIYVGRLGELSLDHNYIAFGGGNDNEIEGTFTGFNIIEIQQGEARITNSLIEHNDNGLGGQGPADRFGRSDHTASTIFVRGAQPILADNVIQNNAAVALTINADSFIHEYINDPGRSTGSIDEIAQFQDNQGPFVRRNRLTNNGLNGMEIRSNVTLSTESVWDDTDIVHILFDEIRTQDFHTYSGLRLESSPTESLVIKLLGPGNLNNNFNTNPTAGAGFTATGNPRDMEDRIGGAIYVLGQPGFPVVLTSLLDDTVGAGVQPNGTPQTDTNNNGRSNEPSPGDWRSVRIDQFAHDRNVEIILEQESPDETAPGLNASIDTAQVLGDLAGSEVAGDDNLRMGFEVHGVLNETNDVDFYSFTAEAGTEVWLDIDRTNYSLDAIIEVLDADGVLIAQSDNSTQESVKGDVVFDGGAIADQAANTLQKLPDQYQVHHASGLVKDHWTVNPRDAGLRVVLPGVAGQRSAYHFLIRSSSLDTLEDSAELQDPNQRGAGLTSGVYRLQVRTREIDEVPGSTVRFADIRYAQNGIEVMGHPAHSALLGEAGEDERMGDLANNDSIAGGAVPGQRPQNLGNLFASDRAVQSISGILGDGGDIDFYEFTVRYTDVTDPSTQHMALTFDLDYADGLSRPNTVLTVFDASGTPVLIGRDSNISDDRIFNANDLSGLTDLSRGSVGGLDPFIGSVMLPEGQYYVAVSSNRRLPNEVLDTANVRLEPINSTIRIAEDRIGSFGGTTSKPPVVPVLLNPTFVGTGANLWHVSTDESAAPGHGIDRAFDGSRIFGNPAGTLAESEPNNSIGTADSLEVLFWSLQSNPNIGDTVGDTSTTIPHVTVTGNTTQGGGTFDYFSFTVHQAGSRGIFDLDFGDQLGLPGDFDGELFLYDAAGNVLASNDDFNFAAGSGGSVSDHDPYLEYVFPTAGQYVIGVGENNSTGAPNGIVGNPLDTGDSYTLQVSLENHPTPTTTLELGGQTFHFGREGSAGYNPATGAPSGTLTSNSFSLQDYSAKDKPVLYFNYRLEADFTDFFRVHVVDAGGTADIVASSNFAEVGTDVRQLTNDGQWRQARIPLDKFAGKSGLTLQFNFQGDAFGNLGEGVHIDDVILGFAERGEMITGAAADSSFSFFNPDSPAGETISGEYQLEIRKSTPYARSLESGFFTNSLTLDNTFDTNARQGQSTTLIAPAGNTVVDRQTFTINDGVDTLTFEYDNNGSITSGRVRIQFSSSDPDYVIARRIRDAINSGSVQGILNLKAGLSDGTVLGATSQDNHVNLYGEVAVAGGIPSVRHEGFGDSNHFRDQGQVLIHSNTILDAADFGIVVDGGVRDNPQDDPTETGQPHMGVVRGLRVLNNLQTAGMAAGFAPGVVVENNTIQVSGRGAISDVNGGFAQGRGIGGVHASGELRPFELAIQDRTTVPLVLTAGDQVADGTQFLISSYRTTVIFEFEDFSDHVPPVTSCGDGVGLGDGWTPGTVPIFYRRTDASRPGYSEFEMQAAILAAIRSSVLVTNDTTLVAEARPGTALGAVDQMGGLDVSVYLDNVRDVQMVSFGKTAFCVDLGPFSLIRVMDVADGVQPFHRIVNNTIYGRDGNSAFFPETPTIEPNDTIFNAIDTKQGRSQSPEVYTQNNVSLNDNTVNFPSATGRDVDIYQFQMDIDDRLVASVTGLGGVGGNNPFVPEVRMFNSIGEEFVCQAGGSPIGRPICTTVGSTVNINFYADIGDTYFLAVSNPGNDEYNPLSLGTRQDPTAVGRYNISVDVMAPRVWMIDTLPLVTAAGSFAVTDVDGNTKIVSAGPVALTANNPAVVGTLVGQINGVPPGPALNGVRAYSLGSGQGARYVAIKGASRVIQTAGPIYTTGGLVERTLMPALNLNNDEDDIIPETGIMISEESTPTLLNNVLANLRNAIIEIENQPLENSPLSSVVGATIFQHNTDIFGPTIQDDYGNWRRSDTGGIESEEFLDFNLPVDADFNVQVPNADSLFVNAPGSNFFPDEGALSIDSSVDSLQDRAEFILIKQPMGISNSPILAPDHDVTGQLRGDDPDVATPDSQGADVFKDRGSLDRSDFIGPAAVLNVPRDNDAFGNDIDPTATVIHLTEGVYPEFVIQIIDGFEAADPFPGVGVNDNSVLGPIGPEGRLPGSVVTIFQDGRLLEEGVDYTYRYVTTSNQIVLTPTAGIWPDDKVYQIKLNNRNRFVVNAPDGSQVDDGDSFQITDDNGVEVTFEYDSGFSLHAPETLVVNVPRNGAGFGGITDGQRFVVNRRFVDMLGVVTDVGVTFEFDFNNDVLGSNIPVVFTPTSSQFEIATAMLAALTGPAATAAGLTLSPKLLDNGQRVHLGAPLGYSFDQRLSTLTQPGTTLGLIVPLTGRNPVTGVSDGDTFQLSDGTSTQLFEFNAGGGLINANALAVNIVTAITREEIADAIVTAVTSSPLDLIGTRHLGTGIVYLGGNSGSTLTATPNGTNPGVFATNVAHPFQDAETFTIGLDTDGNGTADRQVTFEFDDDSPASLTNPTHTAIPFTLQDTHTEIADRMAATILAVQLTPATDIQLPETKHLGKGLVHLGGTKDHTLATPPQFSLSQSGLPDVQVSTTLILPGFLTILVPSTGGTFIADGETFTISDGVQVKTFEFHNLNLGPPNVVPPRELVSFRPTDDAMTIANELIRAITGIAPPFVGITPTLINGKDVELTGSNGNHMLDTVTNSPSLTQSGGRVQDTEIFTIQLGGVQYVYEFDNNGRITAGNQAILFNNASTTDEIANRMVAAITSTTPLGLMPVNLGNGRVRLFDTSQHQTILPANTSLMREGIAGGAIPVVFTPSDIFTGEDFAEALINAINGNGDLVGVSAAHRGGNTLFVDFRNALNEPADYVGGTVNLRNISNYFLPAVQDLPGNWLKANQATDETLFTILLPGAKLDFGDARASFTPSQYPTFFDENGARHVITTAGLFLGDRIDANADGQPVPPAFGDDLDIAFDISGSVLTIAGTAPYTVRLPSIEFVQGGQTVRLVDPALNTKTFSIRDNKTGLLRVFEFDQGHDGIAAGSNVAIGYAAGATISEVGQAMSDAIAGTTLGLHPAHLGADVVHVGGEPVQTIDAAGTAILTDGDPVFLIVAPDPAALKDGDLVVINDGADPVPKRFEIDFNGSVRVGNRRVDVSAAATPADVAAALQAAINAAGLNLTLTNLGGGKIHVAGPSSHTLNLGASGIVFDGHTPFRMTSRSAGLSFVLTPELKIQVKNAFAGGVVDGESFTLSDGVHSVKFEFDSTVPAQLNDPTAVRIAFTPLEAPELIATAIYNAIVAQTSQANPPGPLLGFNPVNPAGGLVIDLGASIDSHLDTTASGLTQTGPLPDAQTFVINDGTSSVTFEIDLGGAAPIASRIPVNLSPADSANDIANKIVLAVENAIALGRLSAAAGLAPKNLGGGNIQIGGPGLLSAGGAARLRTTGSAGGVLDTQSFAVTLDGVAEYHFEFDANGQATPGNITIAYNSDSTAAQIADTIVSRIAAAGFPASIVHLGGGLISIDGDDEDGVRFERVFTAGAQVPVVVTASDEGRLDAWIDFNGDGDWNDQFEDVFGNVPLLPGENHLVVTVPVNAVTGDTFSRFRFSSQGGLAPTGLAIDGEVEDYLIEIVDNDPPTLSVPAPVSANEDVSRPINGIAVQDSDALTAPIEVRLEVLNGNLTVTAGIPGGLTVANINPGGADPDCGVLAAGTCTVLVRGTLTQINTTFSNANGVIYVSDQHFNGDDLLTVMVNDLGNSGTGGPQTVFATVPITVAAVNDAPAIAKPGTQTVNEDALLTFPAGSISIADVEYTRLEVPATTTIRATLSVTRGVLNLKNNVVGGVSAAEILGNGTNTVVITATPARINATLADAAGLVYDSNLNVDQDDTLTIRVEDLGNLGSGGPQTTIDTVAIDIVPLNDDPVITLPAALSAQEDTALRMAGFNVTDVDSAAANITVTLQVSNRTPVGGPNGVLTINAVTGGVNLATQVAGNGSSLVTLTAPVAAISTTLSNVNGWTYTPPSNFAGIAVGDATELLTITANDGGNSGAANPPGDNLDVRSVTISVLAINDPPAVSLTSVTMTPVNVGDPTTPTEDIAMTIRGVSITDPDVGGAEMTVTLAAQRGTIGVPAAAGVTITSNNTASVLLRGTLAAINSLLSAPGFNYTPNADYNGSETVRITANDLGNFPAPAQTGSADLIFNLAAVNDAPIINLPPAQSVQEDMPLPIPSFSITDVDAGLGNINVALQVTRGSLAISNIAGVTITRTSTRDLNLLGPVGSINVALATLTYQGDLHFNGGDTLSIVADDRGNSPGTPATSLATAANLAINVVAVNDAPTIDLTVMTPSPLAVNEDTDLNIRGVTVGDVDLSELPGTGQMILVLQVTSGTLQVAPAGATVTGNGSNRVQLTGTLAQLNATLAGGGNGFVYRGNLHFNGSDTLSFMADDQGNSPQPRQTTTLTRPITVRQVNDAPVVSVQLDPGTGQPQTRTVSEDPTAALDLALSPISISDPDIARGEGNGLVSVLLTARRGILHVATNVAGGITLGNVATNDSASVQIVNATPAQVNETFRTLSGLTYRPNANYNDLVGAATSNPELIVVTVSDLGNGSPPPVVALQGAASIPISVTPVNDAPVINPPATQLATEDIARPMPFPANTITDVDAAESTPGLVTVTLNVANGTLAIRTDVPGNALRPGDFVAGTNGTDNVIFTASPTAINNTLSNLTGVSYTPDRDFNGNDTITILVNDLGNTDLNTGTGLASPRTDTRSFTVMVAAVNDRPELSVPNSPVTIAEDTPLSFHGANQIAVTDVDSGQLTLTMTVVRGTLTVNPNVPGGLGVTDILVNGGLLIQVRGTATQINNTFGASGGVVYLPNPNFHGTDQLDVQLSDLIDTVTANVGLVITPVNDPPVITNPGAQAVIEDTAAPVAIAVDDVELADGITWTVTLRVNSGTLNVRNDVIGGITGNIPGNNTGVVTLVGDGARIQKTLATGVSYQGLLNFVGTDQLRVSILDPGALPTSVDDRTVAATIALNVSGVNDDPVVNLPILPSVNEDAPLVIGGGSPISIQDVDAGLADIQVTLVVNNGTLQINTQAAGGLRGGDIQGNGTGSVLLTGSLDEINATLADANGVTYRGLSEFSGSDMLTVTANDLGASGDGGSKTDSESVEIVVNTVNDPPVIARPVADFSVQEDAPDTLIELFPGVFADPDNNTLTLTVTGNTNPSLVAAAIQGTRLTLDYQPNRNGQSVIRVTASDGTTAVTDEFTVTVNAVNDAPTVANPIPDVVVLEGTASRVVDLTGVFSDPDFGNGDQIVVSYNDFVNNTNRGLVQGSLSGNLLTLTFSPGRGGVANLTVRATDLVGLSTTDTFQVVVNLAPVASNIAVTTKEDTTATIPPQATDSDGIVDLTTLAIVAGSGPAHGTVTVSNGAMVYTPAANYSGPDSFRYTVRDDDGFQSNQATVNITVEAVPDYQNPFLNPDVNRDGSVSPIDALILINQINTAGTTLPPDPVPPNTPEFYFDVNGDGIVSALDVLEVITAINNQNVGPSNGEGEGEGDVLVGADRGADPDAAKASALIGTPSLLVAPDYSFAQPLAEMPAAKIAPRMKPVATAPRSEPATAVPVSRDEEETVHDDIARELRRDGLDDILALIASDIDGAHGDSLLEDLVLSGLKPRHSGP